MVQTVEVLKAVEVLDVRVCAAKRARVESVSQTVQIQALSSRSPICFGRSWTDGADPSAVVVEVDLHGVRRLMLHA